MQELKERIQFIDETLNPHFLTKYHLHLHLSPNGLSFGIYNPAAKRLIGCASYTQVSSQLHLDLIFSKEPLLHGQYHEVKVMFTNNLFTFIPDELFEPSEIANYLSFNLLEPDAFFQEQNNLKRLGAQNIFCISREPKMVVNKYHPNNKVFHAATPLLEGILENYASDTGNKLFVFSWNTNDMEIAVLRSGKLIHYNYFQVNSKEEFIYFPLYVCQQLKISRQHIQLIAGGVLDQASPFLKMLTPYFNNIAYTGLPRAYTYAEGLSEKTGNLAWSLASLAGCE